MRPFDSVRSHRAIRVALSRPAPAADAPRVFRQRFHRGPVDWDVPTVFRRRGVSVTRGA